MENRLAVDGRAARGGALIALAAIATITVAWWALALWPAGAVEPAWLARTRAACFGSVRGGLPDAGGWILLVGEPLGMAAMLALVYGRSLRQDIEWVRAHRVWKVVTLSFGAVVMMSVAFLGAQASGLFAAASTRPGLVAGRLEHVDRLAPDVALVDQHGRQLNLAYPSGGRVLLTFAFGHCATVCPAIVSNLERARREAMLQGVPIVILTLDPWRDTPDRLPALAEHWSLSDGDRVLSGDVAHVNQALDALGLGRRRNDATGDIDHATTVMILDERGRISWRVDGAPGRIAALLRKL